MRFLQSEAYRAGVLRAIVCRHHVCAGIICLPIASDFAINDSPTPPRMLVLLYDAYACALRQQQAAGAPVKRAIRVWIVARGAQAAVGHHEQDLRLQKSLGPAGDDNIRRAAPDRIEGHAYCIQAARRIVNGRFAVTLNTIADGGLACIRYLEPCYRRVGVYIARAARVERLELLQDVLYSAGGIGDNRSYGARILLRQCKVGIL